MALSTLRKRIKKAQMKALGKEKLELIATLIAKGAFYDELTEEEKNIYCEYYGNNREAMENLYGYINGGGLHFQLEKKPRPPTEEELRQRIKKVEAWLQSSIEEYNSPENQAKLKAEYQAMPGNHERTAQNE